MFCNDEIFNKTCNCLACLTSAVACIEPEWMNSCQNSLILSVFPIVNFYQKSCLKLEVADMIDSWVMIEMID